MGIAYMNAGDPAKAKAVLEAVLPKIEDPAIRSQVESYIKSIRTPGSRAAGAGFQAFQEGQPLFDERPAVRAEVLEDAALEGEIPQARVVGLETDRPVEADPGQRPKDRFPRDQSAAGTPRSVLAGVDEGEPRAESAQSLGIIADLGDGVIGVERGLDVGVLGEGDEPGELGRRVDEVGSGTGSSARGPG